MASQVQPRLVTMKPLVRYRLYLRDCPSPVAVTAHDLDWTATHLRLLLRTGQEVATCKRVDLMRIEVDEQRSSGDLGPAA
jgi:hypothetical protein